MKGHKSQEGQFFTFLCPSKTSLVLLKHSTLGSLKKGFSGFTFALSSFKSPQEGLFITVKMPTFHSSRLSDRYHSGSGSKFGLFIEAWLCPCLYQIILTIKFISTKKSLVKCVFTWKKVPLNLTVKYFYISV